MEVRPGVRYGQELELPRVVGGVGGGVIASVVALLLSESGWIWSPGP